jgi:hypothetical protein
LLQVIVGGTRVADDWYVVSSLFILPKGCIEIYIFLSALFNLIRYPRPRKEITQDILERGFGLCPELAMVMDTKHLGDVRFFGVVGTSMNSDAVALVLLLLLQYVYLSD